MTTATAPAPATRASTKRKVTTWSTRALDPRTGQVVQDKIDAASEDEAKAALRLRGLTPLQVKAKATGLNMEIGGFSKRVKPDDLALFARMFATMIASAMTMLRALEVVARQTENPTLKATLDAVRTEVQNGSSLSDAMANHPTVFPPLMTNMVRSGEVGGYLETALLQIADSTEADVKIRSKVKSAATYPVVVLCLGIVATIGMVIFIVPIFATMFADLGGELPVPTRIVVAISDFMKVAVLPLIGLVAAFLVWWHKAKNTEKVRGFVDPLKLRLPVFGPLVRKIAVGRLTRNLAVTLSSGVPLLEALRVVAGTAGNVQVRDAVTGAAAHVKQGEALAAHLGDGDVVPDMVVQMVQVGEESGTLSEMLERATAFYDQQIEATLDKLSALIEPLLIVAIGVMLGSLIVAMYMPIFSVFELIQ